MDFRYNGLSSRSPEVHYDETRLYSDTIDKEEFLPRRRRTNLSEDASTTSFSSESSSLATPLGILVFVLAGVACGVGQSLITRACVVGGKLALTKAAQDRVGAGLVGTGVLFSVTSV